MNVSDRDRVLSYWRQADLHRLAEDELSGSALRPRCREFLEEVGLVRDSRRLAQGLGVRFDVPLTPLYELIKEFDGKPNEDWSWYVIGHCFERLISVSMSTGCVCLLDGSPREGALEWFVNSGVPELMVSLTIVMEWTDAVVAGADKSTLTTAAEAIAARDPAAFEKRVHWWPTILKEMERGHL